MSEVAAEPADCHDQATLQRVRQRLSTYLQQLGVTDAGLVARLMEESMQRAERRSAPGATDELMRRALEEIQHRIDAAVAKVYGLNPVKDAHRVAAARALSLRSNAARLRLETLLRHALSEAPLEIPALPAATPPEARLTMHPEPIAFFFGPSTSSSH